jgi:hypothetical protein
LVKYALHETLSLSEFNFKQNCSGAIISIKLPAIKFYKNLFSLTELGLAKDELTDGQKAVVKLTGAFFFKPLDASAANIAKQGPT